MNNRNALLVVSFGTSYESVIDSCIAPVEAAIRSAAPDYDFFRAFTSRMILRKLEKVSHIHIPTPPQALEALREQGYTRIVVQPTHILAGTEYHDVEAEVRDFAQKHPDMDIVLGQPVLYENEDYERVAAALGRWMPETADNEVVLLMGHGTEHFSNSSYFALQHYLDKLSTRAVYVANVEAPPVLHDVMEEMHGEAVTKVYLMPFMLVAGDHAHHDMAGSGEDSWKSVLEADGFQVEIIMRGLGESEAFREIYREKASAAISGYSKNNRI